MSKSLPPPKNEIGHCKNCSPLANIVN